MFGYISQVIRVKSYNSSLMFLSNFLLLLCGTIFYFFIFFTNTFIWTHKCLYFRAKLGARQEPKLSSLCSTLAKIPRACLVSKKNSTVPHRIFGHMHEALNIVEKNNSLHSLTVNDETNLLNLISP